jgi:regulator of protease activity HflC (stomatin/prohibitin superfamily)
LLHKRYIYHYQFGVIFEPHPKTITMKIKKIFVLFGLAILSSCVVVNPGYVGVKSTLGNLKPRVYQPGLISVNPFITRVVVVPTRTVNLEVRLNLPSKEGLNVLAEISILYHIESNEAPNVIQTVGERYEDVMILSVFRSAAADVCSRYMAKDMHSGQRSVIEDAIKNHMDSLIEDRGFVIESVLMKSISLPSGLYEAIESKLEAEQIAQRMEFELEQERLEAQRKKIEAQGVRDAQQVLAEGLSEEIIKWRSLEVLEKLSASPNAKLIITDGTAPVLISEDGK